MIALDVVNEGPAARKVGDHKGEDGGERQRPGQMRTGQAGQDRAQAATAHQHGNGDKTSAVRTPVVDDVAFEGA